MITVNCPAHGKEKRDRRFAELEEAIRQEQERDRALSNAERQRHYRERKRTEEQEKQS